MSNAYMNNFNSLEPSRLPFKAILICNRFKGAIASYQRYGVDLGSCLRQLCWGIDELEQLQRRCRTWSSQEAYGQIKSRLIAGFPKEKLEKIAGDLSQSNEAHDQEFVAQIKKALAKYQFQLSICEGQLNWRYGHDRGWRPIQAESIAVY